MALRPPLGDLYDELGIEPGATREEVAAAYRARAKELHPDTRPLDADAAERFTRVGLAYRVLSDPDQRARYDASLLAPPPVEPRPAPPVATPAPHRGGPAPRKPHRLSRKGARWCAWGGAALVVLGLVVGAFVFSLQRHDANLRAHGVGTTAVVVPVNGGTGERRLEFETRDGKVVRAQESVRTGEEQPAIGSRVKIYYDPKDPSTIVSDVSHTGRNVTLWIVSVKLVIGGAVLVGFGVRRLRRLHRA